MKNCNRFRNVFKIITLNSTGEFTRHLTNSLLQQSSLQIQCKIILAK